MLTRNCIVLKHGVAVRKSKSFKDAAEEVKGKFFIREIRQSDDEAMEED